MVHPYLSLHFVATRGRSCRAIPIWKPYMIVTDQDHPFADFRNFLYVCWKFLGLPDPTPVQYDIAYTLQHGDERMVIEAYRGAGKSFILSAFAVWVLYWQPSFKIMVVSASKDRADAFSQFCLRLILEMPELAHLIPKANQRRSLVAFDVAGSGVDHSPSVRSLGITSQLAGSRADLIIPDDIEVPNNSMTQAQREKLLERVKEFDAILKPLPHARIVFLGTPQCEDSLYTHLGKRGYKTYIWTARKPSKEAEGRYEGKLAQFIIDQDIPENAPIDPKRFNEEDLRKREASYGRTGFALQFMLDTSMSDGLKYPLSCRDFIVSDIDVDICPVQYSYGSHEDQMVDIGCVGLKGDRWYAPLFMSKEFVPYEECILFVDPAGRGADKTAVVVVKKRGGFLFLRRALTMTGGYDDGTLTAIARLAATEKANRIIVESNFGDGMFNQLLKPVVNRTYPCAIEEVRHNKQKELRIIDTLEPVLNAHRLVVDRAVILTDMQRDQEHQLFYQLTRVTKDRGALAHDDLLDALAGAVAYYAPKMALDTTDAEKAHKDSMLDNEIEKWLSYHGASGGYRKNPNFTVTV